MRILGLVASPRRGVNTDILVETLLASAAENGQQGCSGWKAPICGGTNDDTLGHS